MIYRNTLTAGALALVAFASFASSARALTEMTMADGQPVMGQVNKKSVSSFNSRDFQAPCVMRLRAKTTRLHTMEIYYEKTGGSLFFSRKDFENNRLGVAEGDTTRIDCVIVFTPEQAWSVLETGETVPCNRWKFSNPAGNRRAYMCFVLWGKPSATPQLDDVHIAYQAITVSKSEREKLNSGKCPDELMRRLKATGVFSKDAATGAPVAAVPANAGPVERLRALNETEKNKIVAATEKLAGENRAAVQAQLIALRNTLTRQEKLDAAIAVKAIADDPDSAEARTRAPDEAKAILLPYDKAKETIEADGAAASATLKKQLLVALNAEQSAAMKRGDFDTTVALKKIIEAGGEFDAAPAVVPPVIVTPEEVVAKQPAEPTMPPARPQPDPENTLFGRRVKPEEKPAAP